MKYQTLVRPRLEYASSIGSPWQSYFPNKLISVQSRSFRFIFSNYSFIATVSGLRVNAGIQSLTLRRQIFRLMLFREDIATTKA